MLLCTFALLLLCASEINNNQNPFLCQFFYPKKTVEEERGQESFSAVLGRENLCSCGFIFYFCYVFLLFDILRRACTELVYTGPVEVSNGWIAIDLVLQIAL